MRSFPKASHIKGRHSMCNLKMINFLETPPSVEETSFSFRFQYGLSFRFDLGQSRNAEHLRFCRTFILTPCSVELKNATFSDLLKL